MSLMSLFWTIEIIVWGTLFYHWYVKICEPLVMQMVALLALVGFILATINIFI